MNKNVKRLVYLVVVCVVAGIAWSAWFYLKSDAASNGDANTVEVKLGSIQSLVTAQGTLEPRYYVDVGAQVSGKVEIMHVDIGDDVKTGDLIAEIDPDIYEAQVEATEARLKAGRRHGGHRQRRNDERNRDGGQTDGMTPGRACRAPHHDGTRCTTHPTSARTPAYAA